MLPPTIHLRYAKTSLRLVHEASNHLYYAIVILRQWKCMETPYAVCPAQPSPCPVCALGQSCATIDGDCDTFAVNICAGHNFLPSSCVWSPSSSYIFSSSSRLSWSSASNSVSVSATNLVSSRGDRPRVTEERMFVLVEVTISSLFPS